MPNNKKPSYKQFRMFKEEPAPYSIDKSLKRKGDVMKTFTKEILIEELKYIRDMGWIPNARPGNAGGVGNTIEDLLGIEENNLPIPNTAEWELKCQRSNTTSLTTLFHMEPSPRAIRFVPRVLLPNYGWRHAEAGKKRPETEKSFRQTIHGKMHSNRGFSVIIDRKNRKVLVSFDHSKVSDEHSEWLKGVKENTGIGELDPQPYWGFDDLFHKAGTKLLNCFFLQADRKRESGIEYFWYQKIFILQNLNIEYFANALEAGIMKIDFDARTGHNHGTKFRLSPNDLPNLYDSVQEI